jgi:prophage regulatory protein
MSVGNTHQDAATDSVTEYLSAPELEQLTGTPASTWRYWAHIRSGPPSFKLGRRRVWKRSTVLAWIAEQEQASQRTDDPRGVGVA